MLYEDEDSDDDENDVGDEEYINLGDVSDNDDGDEEVESGDGLPRSSKITSNKRKRPSSLEEPNSDDREAKKKKLSHSNDEEAETTDAKSCEQDSEEETRWGMLKYMLSTGY